MNKASRADERGRAYTFSPGKLQEKDKLKGPRKRRWRSKNGGWLGQKERYDVLNDGS